MWGTAAATALAGSVVVERVNARDALQPVVQAPEIPGLRPQLVCPGDVVAAELGVLRGRGIVERDDGKLVSTVVGVVEQVNKLIYVRPLKHRYAGSIGDVVVGRVVDVQNERWAVEIGTSMQAQLHIGAVNLQGNVQRRRTDEDVMKMREMYEEGDLISAEVQKVHESGELSLQTRNSRYGKLQNGVLVSIPSVYIRRQAQHLVTMQGIGIMVVLGNNGMIWICSLPKIVGTGRQETINFSQMDLRYEQVGEGMRGRISRVRNSILCLAAHGFEVTPESIQYVYDQADVRGLAAWELLDVARCASCGITEAIVDFVASGSGVGDAMNGER